MRRLATSLLLLITGCSSSGSGSGSGAAATGTATAAAAAAATATASTAAAAPAGGTIEESQATARVLAFSLAAQAMAPCYSDSDAPPCKDQKRLTWLTENVDWQLYGAAELVLDLERDGTPDAKQRVAQSAMGGVDNWKSVVPLHSGSFGSQMANGGKPCKIAPTDDEDRKIAKRWFDAKPQEFLSSDIKERLERILQRRSSYQKLYSLRCGENRVVVALEEGGDRRVFPMTE